MAALMSLTLLSSAQRVEIILASDSISYEHVLCDSGSVLRGRSVESMRYQRKVLLFLEQKILACFTDTAVALNLTPIT